MASPTTTVAPCQNAERTDCNTGDQKDSSGILKVAWTMYLNQLNRQPLLTKAVTSACIAALSDVIAQLIVSGRYTHVQRTLTVACYGFCYNGPSAHYWQKFMEWLFAGKRDARTVLVKTFIDQVSYGPICNILFMSFASLALEGKSVGYTAQRLKRDYVNVQMFGWRLWPLASFINYKYVPVKFRVLFVNVVALVWTTFLLLRARIQARRAAARKAA